MAMKTCKECGTEISSGAKTCPKCGKDQRNFLAKHKALVFILIIVILVAIVAAGSNSNNTVQTGGSIITNQQQEKFTLESSNITEQNSYAFYIGGTIKNNTNKQYSYVQVIFNVYDADGAQIGTAIDNINNLEANGVWKYNAMFMGTDASNATSYKFVEITGW